VAAELHGERQADVSQADDGNSGHFVNVSVANQPAF
jgi:hypothetical protein